MSLVRGILRVIIPWDGIQVEDRTTGRGCTTPHFLHFICVFPLSTQYAMEGRAWATDKKNIDLGCIDLDLDHLDWISPEIQWARISKEEPLQCSNTCLGFDADLHLFV